MYNLLDKGHIIVSVADPGWLSRILFLSIPDPGSTIFCSNKYYKIVNNFIFNRQGNSFYSTRIIVLFTLKIVIYEQLSKLWVWDPGSRVSKRHWIPDLDTQH
jgi:hypothetical protein